MSETKFKRFTATEISYHWAYAIPFLALLASGALLFLERASGWEFFAREALAAFHRYSGIAFIALPFLIAMAGDWRLHLLNLIEAVTWKKQDLLWMWRMMKRSKDVPAAGKFNPGQKINMLAVLGLYFGFSVTGTLMWAKGTALYAWYLHIACFGMAVPILGGHLFLALLNPSTRPGLPGIFIGRVPMRYISHHHALLLNPEAKGPSYREIWRLAMVVPAALVGAALAVAVARSGFFEKTAGKMPRFNAAMIMPGTLFVAHRTAEGTDNCYLCHVLDGPVSDEKCLACHDEVKERIAAKIGYHARFAHDCPSCHRDHRGADFDPIALAPEEFNHGMAAFALVGKHEQVPCEKCHATGAARTFIGLASEKCLDCHADPHLGQLDSRCTGCHSEGGWKGKELRFEHDRAEFKLLGKHREVACDKCHPETKSGAAEFTRYEMNHSQCTDCHKDEHRGEVAPPCERCHGESGWHALAGFAHDRDSRFALLGRHKNVACSACHRRNDELRLARFAHENCRDCHVDPHGGQFAKKCAQCHAETGWVGRDLHFDHNADSRFQLTGRHAAVACEKCHRTKDKTVVYAGTEFAGCGKCHNDVHRKQLGKKCHTCHNTSGWREVSFDHDRNTDFPLRHDHSGLECSSCHEQKNLYRVPDFSCSSCHPDYAEIIAGTYKTSTPLPDPHFRVVSCEKCHADAVQRSTGAPEQMCRRCHTPHYARLYSERELVVTEKLRETHWDEAKRKAMRKIGSHNFALFRSILESGADGHGKEDQ